MLTKLPIHLLLILFIAGCGVSEQESELYSSCLKSADRLDAYDSNGDHLPKTRIGKRLISDVCAVKAELYMEGYRVSTTISHRDIAIYQEHFLHDKDLKSLYLNSIRN